MNWRKTMNILPVSNTSFGGGKIQARVIYKGDISERKFDVDNIKGIDSSSIKEQDSEDGMVRKYVFDRPGGHAAVDALKAYVLLKNSSDISEDMVIDIDRVRV